MTKKKNCWEVMDCGRGPGNGGLVCSAVSEHRLDGVHGGINAGRACWVVAGTFCNGALAKGTFAQKMETCLECRFYKQVREEESSLHSHYDLLIKIR